MVVQASMIDILLNDGADILEGDVRIIERAKSPTSVDEIDKDILSVDRKEIKQLERLIKK